MPSPLRLTGGAKLRRRAFAVVGPLLLGPLLVSLGILAVRGLFDGDKLTVTVTNETGRPLKAMVVTGDEGFSLPLGDLDAGAAVTKAARFRVDQGEGHLSFQDGTAKAVIDIGYLLDDDGPYEIEARVRPTKVVVHVDKPSDAPATWTVDR